VTVDASRDLERRRLSLHNRSGRPRRLEITSYLEVVLNDPNADAAHPAFSKLFVQTGRDPASGALLAWRRPRAAEERWPWLVHAVAGAQVASWETDRRRFLGRGGTPSAPAALVGRGSALRDARQCPGSRAQPARRSRVWSRTGKPKSSF
jgi:N,N'-diacetylchitobiose phosphorylase